VNSQLNDAKETITREDVDALESCLNLIKTFVDKVPIVQRKLNLKTIVKKTEQLRNSIEANNKASFKDFLQILKKLKRKLGRDIFPELFFIHGGHGGIIVDDIGFCEFDYPLFALNRLLEKMNLALENNMPFSIEVAVSCLSWLKDQHPVEFSEFVNLFKKGRFELINSTYSQPYNLLIGAESNVKQFESGINTLKQIGLECIIYYASECSLHPQIPQILKLFGIEFCSLRTRLLGTCPTTYSGNIDWTGLDGTNIRTITDQPGVLNGELWHGVFFQEIPGLLFQAVSRPFLTHMIFSCLEDFVVPLPYNKEVWKISKYVDVFGKFVSCSELFELVEKNGEFKFNRDMFSVGANVFVTSDLFLNNKKCEIELLTVEILNCILKEFDEDSADSLIESMWEKLLLTQAHDCYAVPFMHNGDYSSQQLSPEEYRKYRTNSRNISISNLSMEIQKKIQEQCGLYVAKGLSKIINRSKKKLNGENDDGSSVIVFNPTTYSRNDVVNIRCEIMNPSNIEIVNNKGEVIDFAYQDSSIKFISKVPPVGYAIYSLVKRGNNKVPEQGNELGFFYEIKTSKDKKSLEVSFNHEKAFDISFDCAIDYTLEEYDHQRNAIEDSLSFHGNMSNGTFEIKTTQYESVNRLEFTLNALSLKHFVVHPHMKISSSFVNYPFGTEETKRTDIQTLDFLWLRGRHEGLVFVQKNSQKFKINRDTFSIRNVITRNGLYEFALAITSKNSFTTAYYHATTYFFKLKAVEINGTYGTSCS
jgi:hypothetical protein